MSAEFVSVNPATGARVARHPVLSPDEAHRALERSQAAFLVWSRASLDERAARMNRAGELLRGRQDDLATLMAREMGKPLREGRAEIAKCAGCCDYFARNAADFLKDEIIPTEAAASFVAYRPLGVVLAIMPWNFPFWQVVRFAAPALMAGNAGLLKHAPNVQGCATALVDLFRDAGFPEDLFLNLPIDTDTVGTLIDHPLVRAVTLTGSTRAGRAVAARAGAALKKTVLELGGSDPYIVLEDADLDRAVEVSVASRLINGGQSCIAAKRFIVVRARMEEFAGKIVERMRAKKTGDPFDPETDLGPMARHDLRDELHRQVRASVDRGARCLLGGELPPGRGAFYPPTVLADVAPGMPAYSEELFGPVAALISAADETEALRLANDSEYGLGAAVFTRRAEHGQGLATFEIEAGSCFVNDLVRSDARLPFGGIKSSGFGRELGAHGIREFVNIKTVWRA